MKIIPFLYSPFVRSVHGSKNRKTKLKSGNKHDINKQSVYYKYLLFVTKQRKTSLTIKGRISSFSLSTGCEIIHKIDLAFAL